MRAAGVEDASRADKYALTARWMSTALESMATAGG
jgi:hypothetical protein